jgi:hypothetical protein
MKRSEALAILSRDHHQALVVARTLRRADAETAATARDRFLQFWTPHGRLHFRLEEELLLPAYAVHGDPHHPLVLQVLGDHVAIRAQADALAAAPAPTPEMLHTLGDALHAHVRLEERRLFGVIEAAMPADELLALARQLADADSAARSQSGFGICDGLAAGAGRSRWPQSAR